MSLVGEREAAGMAQRVRVDVGEAGARRRRGDEVVHRLARHRLAPLGDEQPGPCVRTDGEIAADGAQLVAGDWLLDREAAVGAPG